MIELTHSLNKKMADRYLYDRYDKFSEENLPSEYFSLDDDSIRVDIPQDETKIKKLMDEVMCLIYMEPDNPYNYHTTYASARGFNSNEIVLEIVGNHSRKIFIYNLTQNEFDLISREKCNEVSFVANMYIICNRGKIGRKYGDFGYILSLLDAGHFIENIKCFSIEEKLSFTLDYNPCTSIDMLRLPKPYQIVPLVKLDITDFFVKKQENLWDNENVNKVKFSDTYTGNKSGSLVDQFIDKVLESKVPIVEKFSNIRTSVKVKELLMRTSSQSAQGYSFFPYECPDDVLDEIIDSVKLSLADVTDDLICVQLVMNTDSVRVYEIKRDHELNGGIWKYDADNSRLVYVADTDVCKVNGLTSTTKFGVQSFEKSKIILFFVANFEVIFKKYGMLSYRLVLLEAGHMCSNLQMVSTKLGYSTVPIGGFYDLEVKKMLKLDHDRVCLYMAAVG